MEMRNEAGAKESRDRNRILCCCRNHHRIAVARTPTICPGSQSLQHPLLLPQSLQNSCRQNTNDLLRPTVVTTPSAVCLLFCLKSSGPLTQGQVLAFYPVPGASRVDPPPPRTREWAVRAWRQAAAGASRSPAFWGSVHGVVNRHQPTQQWSRDTRSRVFITPLLSA